MNWLVNGWLGFKLRWNQAKTDGNQLKAQAESEYVLNGFR